jgi:hypothetical protein
VSVRLIPRDITLCRGIHIDRQSKSISLLDVVSQFWALYGFPFDTGELKIFGSLVKGSGDYRFTLKVIGPSADEPIYSMTTDDVRFPDEATIRPIILTIDDLTLPEEGIYEFQLYEGNEYLGATQLIAHDGSQL